MPSIYKLGRTSRNPYERAQELSDSTGVPLPYEVAAALFVRNAVKVEARLHSVFSDQRVSSSREFFRFSDHNTARAGFRRIVLAMPDQLETFGAANAEHDSIALAQALQKLNELEILTRKQFHTSSAHNARVEQMEQQHYQTLAKKEVSAARTVREYQNNSDALAKRIREIIDYCAEHPDVPARLVYRFITDLGAQTGPR